MFGKKPQKTVVDQAVEAVDRIHLHIAHLHDERDDAVSSFRETADRLAEINEELEQQSTLCSALVGQLNVAKDCINRQHEDNARVREKILDIIGE